MKKIAKRLFAILLCISLCAIPVSATVNTVNSSSGVREQVSRAIAVVFDNSGSMYYDETDPWCQATYALEIFASMLNAGDELQIYPMCEIVTDGHSYDMYHPLSIAGGSNTSLISRISTPEPGGTPLETIEVAKNGLEKMSQKEKWLIVLTDGTYFHNDTGEASQKEVDNTFNKDSSDINIMYLRIGTGTLEVHLNNQKGVSRVTATAKTSAEIPMQMIALCNTIFGRDTLPSNHFDQVSNRINLDLDMSRVIVFAQGGEVGEISLVDDTGRQISCTGLSYTPHYCTSMNGTYGLQNEAAVSHLIGRIAVFENVPKGDYTVSYQGAGSNVNLAVYYEPDVQLRLSLEAPDGREVSRGDKYFPGEYRLNYALVTPEGEEVQSDLLGDVSCTLTTNINGKVNEQTDNGNGSISIDMKAGDTLQFSMDAEYLNGYHIHIDSSELEWFPASGLAIEEPEKLKIKLKAEQTYYQLSKITEGEPIQAIFTVNGSSLSPDQLNALSLLAEGDGLTLSQQMHPSSGSVLLTIDESTASLGSFKVQVSGALVDSYGLPMTADASVTVRIGRYPQWLPAAMTILVILILAILITIFMTRKVLPRKMMVDPSTCRFYVDGDEYRNIQVEFRYNKRRKVGHVSISSPEINNNSCSITFDVTPASRRYVSSANREVIVTNVSISPMSYDTTAKLGADRYRTEDNILKKKDPEMETLLSSETNIDLSTSKGVDGQNETSLRLKVKILFR